MTAKDLRDLVAVRKRIASNEDQGRRLRAQRTALIKSLREFGMSDQDIAEHVGVTRQAVHQWSHGAYVVSMTTSTGQGNAGNASTMTIGQGGEQSG